MHMAIDMTGESLSEALHVRALRIIAKCACNGLTIKELSGALRVSRSTLERQFLRHVGTTPGRELARVRIARAKELLITTNLPIKNIAQAIGYRTTSKFGGFFRRQTGQSPVDYRRRNARPTSDGSSGANSTSPAAPPLNPQVSSKEWHRNLKNPYKNVKNRED